MYPYILILQQIGTNELPLLLSNKENIQSTENFLKDKKNYTEKKTFPC